MKFLQKLFGFLGKTKKRDSKKRDSKKRDSKIRVSTRRNRKMRGG